MAAYSAASSPGGLNDLKGDYISSKNCFSAVPYTKYKILYNTKKYLHKTKQNVQNINMYN